MHPKVGQAIKAVLGETPQHRQRRRGRGRKGGARVGWTSAQVSCSSVTSPRPHQAKAGLPKCFVPTLQSHWGR